MKVLLTGGTGFTGSHVLPLLHQAANSFRCLVRSAENAASLRNHGVDVALGDLGDADAVERACDGCDTLVNVASIGFGHGPGIVSAAERAGVRRAVFVSTTAIFTRLNADTKAVRTAAEAAIRGSRLDWTILRPTMIYGTDRDRNICRLIRYVSRAPVLPVFGSGRCLLQPIYVGDLATAIVAATTTPETIRKDYNLAGRVPLDFNDLVRTVAALMGRRIRLVHLSPRPMVRGLQMAERFRIKLPLKAEQILRLNEDKAFPWDAAQRDFGFSPRSFVDGVEAEIRSMGLSVVAGAGERSIVT